MYMYFIPRSEPMLSPPIRTQTSGPAAQDLAVVISRLKWCSGSSACVRNGNNKNNKKVIIIKRTLGLHIRKPSASIVIHPAAVVYNERRPSLDCVGIIIRYTAVVRGTKYYCYCTYYVIVLSLNGRHIGTFYCFVIMKALFFFSNQNKASTTFLRTKTYFSYMLPLLYDMFPTNMCTSDSMFLRRIIFWEFR